LIRHIARIKVDLKNEEEEKIVFFPPIKGGDGNSILRTLPRVDDDDKNQSASCSNQFSPSHDKKYANDVVVNGSIGINNPYEKGSWVFLRCCPQIQSLCTD
jgi:hypothetical protein